MHITLKCVCVCECERKHQILYSFSIFVWLFCTNSVKFGVDESTRRWTWRTLAGFCPLLLGAEASVKKLAWWILLMRTWVTHSSAQIYGPICWMCWHEGLQAAVSSCHFHLCVCLLLGFPFTWLTSSGLPRKKGRLNHPKELTSSSKIYGNHKKPDGHNNPSANTPILGSSLLWLLVYGHQLALCSI